MKAKPPVKKTGFKPGKGKSWGMKLNDPNKQPKVERLDKDYSDMRKGERMLIATPAIVDGYVRNIPKGKSTSLLTLRKDLATEFGADNTCPLTTGIFLRIVAEAAHEQITKGAAISKVTPFWRAVDPKSPLNKKLSFGTEFVVRQRKRERIDQRA